MKHIFAIQDKITNKLQEPFFIEEGEKSDQVAIRTFRSLVKNPNTIISSKPEDFSLMKLGELDPESGFIKSEQMLIIEAKEL